MKENLCEKLGIVTVKKLGKKMQKYEKQIADLRVELSVAESRVVSESEYNDKLQRAFDLAMEHISPSTPKLMRSSSYWILQVERREREADQRLLRSEPNFFSVSKLDNRSIQELLMQRDVAIRDLALSLMGSEPEIQEAIFRNLSKRMTALLKEDIDFMHPVGHQEVENARIKISKIIRRLIDQNKIMW